MADNTKNCIIIEPVNIVNGGFEIFDSQGESLAISIKGPENQPSLTREEMLKAKTIIWTPKINIISQSKQLSSEQRTHKKVKFSNDAFVLQSSSEYPGATEILDNNGNTICFSFEAPNIDNN